MLHSPWAQTARPPRRRRKQASLRPPRPPLRIQEETCQDFWRPKQRLLRRKLNEFLPRPPPPFSLVSSSPFPYTADPCSSRLFTARPPLFFLAGAPSLLSLVRRYLTRQADRVPPIFFFVSHQASAAVTLLFRHNSPALALHTHIEGKSRACCFHRNRRK